MPKIDFSMVLTDFIVFMFFDSHNGNYPNDLPPTHQQ